jgi:hypothetical protein
MVIYLIYRHLGSRPLFGQQFLIWLFMLDSKPQRLVRLEEAGAQFLTQGIALCLCATVANSFYHEITRVCNIF